MAIIKEHERVVQRTKDILRYRYFLTVVLRSWRVLRQLDKSMEKIVISDFNVLARYNRSHILPLVGINSNRKYNSTPHYHAIALSEHPLSIECLERYDTHQSVQLQSYDNHVRGIVYTSLKHESVGRSTFHPRDRRSRCKNHTCDIATKVRQALK